jgi:hypothetical protein
LQEAVRASAAIFVAVGTPPTDRGDADLSYVESVAREISGATTDTKSSSRRARSRSTPASGSAKLSSATAPTPNRSTSPPTRSFCAKAPRSLTFFFPTASSSAATTSAAPA